MRIPRQNIHAWPFVSIIIPLHVIGKRFFDDLRKFQLLNYPHFEILIVSDTYVDIPKGKKIHLIVTRKRSTGPAQKRDIALKHAKGDIYAFIDDDAYPDRNWLKIAVLHFIRNRDIIAVGGPGVTPPNEAFMSHLGGLVYESKYTSGQAKYRFVSEGQTKMVVQDWPAYNLFVRKATVKKVHGWQSQFYGGEDTYLCMKLLDHGFILYDPAVIVYHHRRPLFLPHLKQIFNVGMHRGYFFKKYPSTSRKLFYLQPTLLTIGFWTLCIASFYWRPVSVMFITLFMFFYCLAFFSVRSKTSFSGSVLVACGIILTHMSYGIGFIRGLFSTNLKR